MIKIPKGKSETDCQLIGYQRFFCANCLHQRSDEMLLIRMPSIANNMVKTTTMAMLMILATDFWVIFIEGLIALKWSLGTVPNIKKATFTVKSDLFDGYANMFRELVFFRPSPA